MKRHWTCLLVVLIFACQPEEMKNEQTEVTVPYEIEKEKVTEGKITAKAISAKHLVSNYQSPANANINRHIEFKFSVNGLDNELPFGVNHHAVISPKDGTYEIPTIKWGVPDKHKVKEIEGFLEPNTDVVFRVDLSAVINSFEQKGFYVFANGEKIMKQDFKGVWVAGGTEPLSWDFENMFNREHLKLKDSDGDGIYEVTVKMNVYNKDNFTETEWQPNNDIEKYPTYTSEWPIVDALYNLSVDEMMQNIEQDGTFRTGAKWPGVWTRDISYSVLLALGAIEPKVSQTSLMRKVKNKKIIQDTGTGGAWPVSTDRLTWALAAWEVYKITGNQHWLNQCYEIVTNSVEDDLRTTYDPETGLAYGESSFLDWRKQTYPIWMTPRDIYKSQCLGTNAVHFQTYNILSRMAHRLGMPTEKWDMKANELKTAINKYLWNSKNGYYSQYRYGYNYLVTSPNAELLGEAFAVLFGIADNERQQQIIKNSPLVPYGVPCVEPQIPNIPPYHNNGIWPFVEAYFAWAAAKAGNEAAVSHAIEGNFRHAAMFLTNKENLVAESGDFKGTEINSDRQLWSVAAGISTIYRVFFGMNFETNGIEFRPFVPTKYVGKKQIKGFRYRKAVLDITLEGFGKEVGEFRVDGKLMKNAFLRSNLEGAHTIEIKLMNEPLPESKINLKQVEFALKMPQVKQEDLTLSWDKIENAKAYRIFRNGKAVAEINTTSYQAHNGAYAEWQVQAVAVNSHLDSYLSRPILIVDDSKLIYKEAESSAKQSDQGLADFTGEGFVELSNKQNTELTFYVSAKHEGKYLIDFRYSNGSGPINTDNKCAIRTLMVNNAEAGAIVMPQRGSDQWSNWGYSNAIAMQLKKGSNKIVLCLKPHNANMNVEINRAMLDHLRVTPL